MKLKLTVILTTLVVTTGLLLGASTAQETEVIFEGNNATGIKNLEVNGVLYNVEFLFDSAENIYGDSLIYDFPGQAKASAASDAVRAALNSVETVTTVGPWEDTEFLIGYDEDEDFVYVTHDVYAAPDGPWQLEDAQTLRWSSNFYTYADFTQEVIETEVVPIPRTGQTQSYYAGDDGDLQKGAPWPVPRFTDNADGTVTDNLTELIWLRFGYCHGVGKPWAETLDVVTQMSAGQCNLTDGSQPGDWRLPNRRELESLIDISRRLPALPAGHPFTEVSGVYWTSTSAAPEPWGEIAAWAVNMTTGEAVIQGKDATGSVLTVRDAIED